MYDPHSFHKSVRGIVFRLILLPLSVLGLSLAAGSVLRESSPFQLKTEEIQHSGQGSLSFETDPEELFPVTRGTIKDIVTLMQKIPEGTYQTSRIVLRGKEAECSYLPGDLIDLPDLSDHLLQKERPGNPILSAQRARVLSVRKGVGECIVTCLPAQQITLNVQLPEKTLNRIHASTEIQAVLGDSILEASVDAIGDQVQDGFYPVKLKIYDRQIIGRNGCTLTIQFLMEEKKNVLKVPADCIFHDQEERAFVLLFTPEEVLSVPVEVGIVEQDMVEIRSGLKEGDLLLPEGSVY